MELSLDLDKTAQFAYNQRQRTIILQEDNSIYRAGLQNDKEHWEAIRQMYVQRGDNAKVTVIDHELEKIGSEQTHYEREWQHLEGVAAIARDLESLPGVRERFRRIEETRRTLQLEGGRSIT